MAIRHWVSVAILLLDASITSAQTASLRAYTVCHFEDGLALVQKSPLPTGVQGRTVQTITGPRHVPVVRGEKLLFGYPGNDPFARVTVEQLPAAGFAENKTDLIAGFDKILASDDSVTRNYALKPTVNGFDINGLDRKQLEGNVLSIYLLLDNTAHMALSIDFLNSQSAQRSFDSLEGYAKLRDQFLATYTACLHAPTPKSTQARAATPKKQQPKKAPLKKKSHG